MGFLKDFLMGKKEKTERFQRFTPGQQDLIGGLGGRTAGQLPDAFKFLQSLLSQDPEQMQAFQAPAMRAFEEQTIPTIAERFTGMNAQKSSAFGQQLGQAGAGLQENLQAQRSGLGMNALSQLQSLLGQSLTPQFQTAFRPGGQGFAQQGASSLAQILPLLMLL